MTTPGPRVAEPELRSPEVDAWDEAVRFLLVDDRAWKLAEQHPLTDGGCGRCARTGCVAAWMAAEALELLKQSSRADGSVVVGSSRRGSTMRKPQPNDILDRR